MSMDGFPGREPIEWNSEPPRTVAAGVGVGARSGRWRAHSAHGPASVAAPHRLIGLRLALRAVGPTRVVLIGGTFNPKAPAYPFLEATWRAYLAAFGMPLALAMPAAGFYPRGGGRLEAWVEPAKPRPWIPTGRGPLLRLRGVAGVANLRDEIARRMRDRAIQRLPAPR